MAWLQHQTLTPMLAGLTPARLAATLRAADEGNLVEQHRLFADMEERDAHLRAEIDKRRSALTMLDWDIVAPPEATAAEKATAQWVEDVLKNAIDPMEDLILTLMEAVGHGFGAVELEWSRWGGELLPSFHPRPQEWFCLDQSRTEMRLRSAAAYTVLRSATARAVIAAGLHPGIGLHHSNDNNAMRLVDDLMEPFRPVIDLKVWQLWRNGEQHVTPETKRALVRTLYDDMQSSAGATPVTVCMQKLATSIAQVYLGQRDKPDLPLPGLPLALVQSLQDE